MLLMIVEGMQYHATLLEGMREHATNDRRGYAGTCHRGSSRACTTMLLMIVEGMQERATNDRRVQSGRMLLTIVEGMPWAHSRLRP